MKKIKEYIQKNATLLFKTNEEKSLKAIFDKKGFWFHEITQPFYYKIKSQPHIYVAFNKHGYYVGISNQSGGRWKRQHAYHLGTLAYHLLGTLRYDDQNHIHWIEAWMKMETLNSNILQNSIILKEEVNICFIPFSLYSEFNNHHTGNTLPPKNIIRKINKEFEAALIQSLKEGGKKMLNVQNLKKKSILQTKSNGKKTPPPKNPKVAIDADFVSANKGCVEFKVTRHQNISEVAQEVRNLPVGPCIIDLFYHNRNDVRKYINGKTRKIPTIGRQVSEYFNAPDANIPKWQIVQAEMNNKKKIIETITIRVCSIKPVKTR